MSHRSHLFLSRGAANHQLAAFTNPQRSYSCNIDNTVICSSFSSASSPFFNRSRPPVLPRLFSLKTLSVSSKLMVRHLGYSRGRRLGDDDVTVVVPPVKETIPATVLESMDPSVLQQESRPGHDPFDTGSRNLSKAERLKIKEKAKRKAALAGKQQTNTKMKQEKNKKAERRESALEQFQPILDEEITDLDISTPGDEKLVDEMLSQIELPPDQQAAREQKEERAKKFAEKEREKKIRMGFNPDDKTELNKQQPDDQDNENRVQKVNKQITCDPIILIGPDGKKIGLVTLSAALTKVKQSNLDLLQLTPDHIRPAICKVVNLEHQRILELMRIQKQQQENLKTHSRQQHFHKQKQIRFRKNIDPHDLAVKIQHAAFFLQKGYSVKFMYIHVNAEATDWTRFFKGIEQKLSSIAIAENYTEKPFAIFHPKISKQTNTTTTTATATAVTLQRDKETDELRTVQQSQ